MFDYKARLEELNNMVKKDINKIEYAVLEALEYSDLEITKETYDKLLSKVKYWEYKLNKHFNVMSLQKVADKIVELYQDEDVDFDNINESDFVF